MRRAPYRTVNGLRARRNASSGFVIGCDGSKNPAITSYAPGIPAGTSRSISGYAIGSSRGTFDATGTISGPSVRQFNIDFSGSTTTAYAVNNRSTDRFNLNAAVNRCPAVNSVPFSTTSACGTGVAVGVRVGVRVGVDAADTLREIAPRFPP